MMIGENAQTVGRYEILRSEGRWAGVDVNHSGDIDSEDAEVFVRSFADYPGRPVYERVQFDDLQAVLTGRGGSTGGEVANSLASQRDFGSPENTDLITFDNLFLTEHHDQQAFRVDEGGRLFLVMDRPLEQRYKEVLGRRFPQES